MAYADPITPAAGTFGWAQPSGAAAIQIKSVEARVLCSRSDAARHYFPRSTGVTAERSSSPVRIGRPSRREARDLAVTYFASGAGGKNRLTVGCTNGSDTLISSLTLSQLHFDGRPRYVSGFRFPPWPRTRLMVSPRTSARYNASSTSLSFSGRMTATMSFIFSASLRANEDCTFAPIVRLFPVLGDVHTDSLLLLPRAQRRDQCYRLKNHERSDSAIGNRSAYRRGLNAELLAISEQSAIGCPVPDLCASTPVSNAPTVPPTPCAAITSSESSSLVPALQRMV